MLDEKAQAWIKSGGPRLARSMSTPIQMSYHLLVVINMIGIKYRPNGTVKCVWGFGLIIKGPVLFRIEYNALFSN